MNIKFIQTNYNKLNTIPIVNGQLLYCIDTYEIYMDTSKDERIIFNDIIILETESERTELLNPILGKMYFVKETNKIYIYITDWIVLNRSIIKEPVFFLGSNLSLGIQPMIIDITDECILDNISAVVSTPGTFSETNLSIEYCDISSDISDEKSWIELEKLTIPINTLLINKSLSESNKSISNCLVRVKILNKDSNIKGITLKLKLLA